MRLLVKTTAFAALLCILPAVVLAQVDRFGELDSIFIDVAKINDHNWSITVSFRNDEWVDALSVPLKLRAGRTKVLGDSAVYSGGRIEHFDFKGFRADTAIQCVTMGMLANLSTKQQTLNPGEGRLVTVFVSSQDGSPIEKLVVDTTSTPPNNSLAVIARRIQPSDTPDTIPFDRFSELQIVPGVEIRYPE